MSARFGGHKCHSFRVAICDDAIIQCMAQQVSGCWGSCRSTIQITCIRESDISSVNSNVQPGMQDPQLV
jgi:hypothetical protein